MSKLNYLIGVSLSRKVKTKWFFVVNVLLCVIISLLINVDSLINLFGGDFNSKKKLYVIDESGFFYEHFNVNFNSMLDEMDDQVSNYEVSLSEDNIESLKEKIKVDENDDIIILIENDSSNLIKSSIISSKYIDFIDMQLLSSSINNTKVQIAIEKSSIDVDDLNRIYNNVSIERIILDDDKSSQEESMNIIMNTVFPLFILPFFMLIIILVQMIGAEVNDEKSTRGMEIIISNVSPGTHFASKVIAGNLFVIGQALLLVVYALLGILIRNLIGGDNITNGVINQVLGSVSEVFSTGITEQLVYIVPITILLMILTFIAYSLLAGILASMTTNTEDFQQLQTPIIIISLIGYYFAMMAGVFKGSLFIRILSYVPLISSILAPSLLVLGQIGIIDIIISFVLVIVFIFILIKYGLRIYKVGILNYSSKDLWKKMFKALKK